MKTTKLFALLLIGATVGLCSCGDDHKDMVVRNLEKSDCKSSLQPSALQLKANGMLTEPEQLALKASADGFLLLQHLNAIYGCDCEKVAYRVSIDGNKILVVEDAGESLVNCVCPIDAQCEIGPLENRDYELTLATKNGQKLAQVQFRYSSQLDSSWDIE